MVVDLERWRDQAYYQRLLEMNHAAFEQHLTKITSLRASLEDEEAKLAFCLYEQKRILAELAERAEAVA